jgi:hypothetical protein
MEEIALKEETATPSKRFQRWQDELKEIFELEANHLGGMKPLFFDEMELNSFFSFFLFFHSIVYAHLRTGHKVSLPFSSSFSTQLRTFWLQILSGKAGGKEKTCR